MAKILITSGPTREFIDPIRFISNQSSGRMGAALATAVLEQGHDVVVVSGPVQISYPKQAVVRQVETTAEMKLAVEAEFSSCHGIIGAAAPCDFRPAARQNSKIKKNGTGMTLVFEETEDILKKVSSTKEPHQWSVGFALESENGLANARQKLKEKNLDLIVLNGVEAMNSERNQVRIISQHAVEKEAAGTKLEVAHEIFAVIAQELIKPLPKSTGSSRADG